MFVSMSLVGYSITIAPSTVRLHICNMYSIHTTAAVPAQPSQQTMNMLYSAPSSCLYTPHCYNATLPSSGRMFDLQGFSFENEMKGQVFNI